MLNPSDLHIQIADYSLRSLTKFAKLFRKYHNLNAWTAPELWNDQSIDNTSVDVYSFGIILWEIETGKVPFEDLLEKQIKSKLLAERVRPWIPEQVCPNLSHLIRRCWKDNANHRPSFKDILDKLTRVKFS